MRLRIERLDSAGLGVAEDGRRLPFTLPGEVVEVAGTSRTEGAALEDPAGGAVRIVEPSPHRVAPPCPAFAACGGCAVQHADFKLVARWKVEMVARALKARGLAPRFGRYHASPTHSRRRVVLAGRCTRGEVVLGFHRRRSHALVDAGGCVVASPRILSARPALNALVRALAPAGREIGLAVTVTDTGLDVALRGARADAAAIADLAPRLAGWGIARLAIDGEVVAQVARPTLRFGSVAVTPPPGGFLQATAAGEAALVRAATRGVGPAGRVADLFAGCGTFTFPLARSCAVHAVEGDGPALKALAAAARAAAGLRAVTAERRDLFRNPLTATELDRFAAVVLDPPRAGAAAQVAEIAASRVARVVHVSCNPATFAREAATLVAAGFEMGPVEVIDQFLFSPHVELVATFRRG